MSCFQLTLKTTKVDLFSLHLNIDFVEAQVAIKKNCLKKGIFSIILLLTQSSCRKHSREPHYTAGIWK